MNNWELFILKKRSIWFHIIVGYLTAGLWVIVYFVTNYNYNKKLKKEAIAKLKEENLDEIKIESDDIEYNPNCEFLYSDNRTRDFSDNYVVLDIETTGLDAQNERITEIGALKYIDNKLTDTFQVLINPEKEISWRITSLTGITNEMVKDCETIDKVLPRLINFIENYDLVLHNSKFDIRFIAYNLYKNNMPLINNKIFCTLENARKYLDLEKYKLEYIKEYFNLDFGSHRALDDCYTTNFLYQHLKQINNKK